MVKHEVIVTVKVKAPSAKQAQKYMKEVMRDLQTEDKILGTDGIGLEVVGVAVVE